MGVSHDAPFDDDHVVLDGTLYDGLKVVLCSTVIYIHACMWCGVGDASTSCNSVCCVAGISFVVRGGAVAVV